MMDFEFCLDKTKTTTKIQSSKYGEQGAFPIVSQEKELISGYWDNEDDVFKHETPIVIFGDHTQVVKYIDFDFVIGADGVKILAPKSFLNPKYFYYWVMSVHIPSHGYARHYRYLKEHQVPVPPLSEQQRIVALLDAEFAKIDALKANAEKNLQNAKDLFQAALKKELEPKEGWNATAISNVSKGSENIKWKNVNVSEKFKYIDLTSVDRSSHSIVDPQIITSQNAPSRAQRIVKTNDVIFATTRPTLKRLCIIPKEYDGNICSTGFCVIRPHLSVLPKWIYYNLSTEEFYDYVEPLQTGATYPAITDNDIRNYTIYLPSIEDQQSIVARLDTLNEKCKTLQANYEKTLSLCDDLKQALLRKAFNGEI